LLPYCPHACRFDKIEAKINSRNGMVTENEPKSIRNGDSALVTLMPIKPLCVEVFSEYPSLGRFIVSSNRRSGRNELFITKIEVYHAH
jgi:elongation factor 1-alpha